MNSFRHYSTVVPLPPHALLPNHHSTYNKDIPLPSLKPSVHRTDVTGLVLLHSSQPYTPLMGLQNVFSVQALNAARYQPVLRWYVGQCLVCLQTPENAAGKVCVQLLVGTVCGSFVCGASQTISVTCCSCHITIFSP